jgi:hypothetical protein
MLNNQKDCLFQEGKLYFKECLYVPEGARCDIVSALHELATGAMAVFSVPRIALPRAFGGRVSLCSSTTSSWAVPPAGHTR